jgi:hypothetical protein
MADDRIERILRSKLRSAGKQVGEARRAYRHAKRATQADLPFSDDGRARIVCRRYAERRAVETLEPPAQLAHVALDTPEQVFGRRRLQLQPAETRVLDQRAAAAGFAEMPEPVNDGAGGARAVS